MLINDSQCNPQSTLDEALACSDRGWSVLPVRKPGKQPLTPHGVKDATTDKATIQRWFGSEKEINLGIATGLVSGGLAVLDVDSRHGGDASLKALIDKYGPLPETVTSATGGGGWHFFFFHPEAISNKVGLAPGLDFRGDGGYVVAPPSLHESGRHYVWERAPYTASLARIPDWLLVLMNSCNHRKNNLFKDQTLSIPEGQRNNILFSIACTMRHRGFSQEAIAAALLMENAKRCDPPLPEEEVLSITSSATRYEPGALLSQGALPRQSDAADTASTSHSLEHLTDLGNAKRLVARHGQDLRYSPLWNKWLVWDGTRWVVDQTGEVIRKAKETVIGTYNEVHQVDTEEWKAVIDHAKRSESEPRLKAMVKLAESEPGIPILPDDLDTDLWLLNVVNGTIDLRTGKLREHRREDLITKLAPVIYDPEAECPIWLAFLHRIMDGNEALITFLQRTMGYALTGAATEQVLFYLYGTGSNGKSTFLETVRTLLGAYAMQTDFTTFLQHKHDSVRNDIARLQGARFVSSVEAETGQRLSESVIKQLTGQDRISARFLYQEYFEYTPQFKLFLAANHKVPIWGTDHAIWRRIRLIPFTVTISEDEKDKGLPAKLRAELPGILAWAVRGCLDWQREGLKAPAEVLMATTGYREEMDIVGGFLEDCCEIDPEAQSSTQGLYEVYERWSEYNGEPVMGKNAFGSKLSERGFTKVRRKSNRGWRGLRVNADWDPWAELKEYHRNQSSN